MQIDLSNFNPREVPVTEQYEHTRTLNIHPLYRFMHELTAEESNLSDFSLIRNDKYYLQATQLRDKFYEWCDGNNSSASITEKVMKNMLFDVKGLVLLKSVKVGGAAKKYTEIDKRAVHGYLAEQYFKDVVDGDVVDLDA